MGDFRLNVDISVVGRDGKKHQIDWWLNWSTARPAEIYKAIIKMAEEAGLEVDYSEIYGDSSIWQDRHIEYLEEKIEKLESEKVI